MQITQAATTTSGTMAVASPQPRLVRAAHEFEAQMMKELMEPLNRGGSLTMGDEGEDQESGSGGALGEFASEALSRALSDGGGFGIAAGIVKQLSTASNRNGTVPVIGNPHTNTAMKLAK